MTSYIDCENNIDDAVLQINCLYSLNADPNHENFGHSFEFTNDLNLIVDSSVEQHGIDDIVYANWVVDVMLKTESVTWTKFLEIIREEGKITRENYIGFCRYMIEFTSSIDKIMLDYLVGLCQKEKCRCEPMNLVLECNDLVSHMSNFVK
jgi:hypothetical protein